MSMDIENTASQHTQYAERHGRGLRASKEGDGQATRIGEYAGHRKKDTVEISEESRVRFSALQIKPLEGDLLAQFKELMEKREDKNDMWRQFIAKQDEEINIAKVNREGTAEHFIFNALKEKMGNAFDVAVQLGGMIFGNDSRSNLEAAAENREAGRDLAKYISENYFDDPKEAKNFMDKMNKFIKNSELKDKGYHHWGLKAMEPIKPECTPDDFYRILEQKGYTDFYNEMWNRVQLSDFRDDEAREAVSEILFEVHDAWKEEFAAKEKFVQGIIDNAKKITDFSSNEKWNNLMNLLSKAI